MVIVYGGKMASPERDGVSVWRIENTQSASRGKREVFSISPYEKMASIDVRRARLEVPNISIDKSISRLQSAVVCGRCGRRIEGEQHIRHTNATTPSISPYEKMALPERDKPRSLR